MIQPIQLDENTSHTITWNLTESRQYSTSSPYMTQFDVSTSTYMMPMVLSNWVPAPQPPNASFFFHGWSSKIECGQMIAFKTGHTEYWRVPTL
jgi:hypothetical protein